METQDENITQPYLPEGRTVKYVPASNEFMFRAKEVARQSNDQQQPTGAVIVCNGKIVAEDSNMSPLRSSWLVELHKKYCIRHIFKIPSGQKYWLCPGCAKNESHAESRAVHKLFKKELANGHYDLYLWGHWWCCSVCWKNMFRLPVRDVFLLENSEVLFNLKSKGNILGKQFNN